MQEQEMEIAVANCPNLFIEPGLTLVRRQVVINGRRPDILFTDVLSRHVLVELQKGRLDESHLQRHFYYFYDYRAKYPDTHLRLFFIFIANRIVPQHKEFLDDHGYKFREYPENEFERKVRECNVTSPSNQLSLKPAETSGVLPAHFHEIIYEIEGQEMTMCYKMLLLIMMAEHADPSGRVQLQILTECFKEFFTKRALNGKIEENPKRVRDGVLSSVPRQSGSA